MMSANTEKISALPQLTEGDTHPDLVEVNKYLNNFGYIINRSTDLGIYDRGSNLVRLDTVSVENTDLRDLSSNSAINEESILISDLEDLTLIRDMEDQAFDIILKKAVVKFQENMGLDVTGDLNAETVEVMALPRCGMPDFDPISAIAVGPWTRLNISYAFGQLTNLINNSLVKVAIRNAFSTWQHAGVHFQFEEVQPNETVDILIEWRQSPDTDRNMEGPIVAHADYPPGFSIISETLPLPIHFDSLEAWSIGKFAGKHDIETIALHEIGHSLGLIHSPIRSSVMYAVQRPNNIRTNLDPDDISGLKILYGL